MSSPTSQAPRKGARGDCGLPAQKGAGLFLLSPTVWSTEGALTEGVRSQRRAETLGKARVKGGWQSQRRERVFTGAMGPAHPTPLVRKVSPPSAPPSLYQVAPSLSLCRPGLDTRVVDLGVGGRGGTPVL